MMENKIKQVINNLANFYINNAQKMALRQWVNKRDSEKIGENGTLIRRNKYLYAAPIGKSGKELLEKLIKKLDAEHFDFLIFVYDDCKFDEEIFSKCTFIYERGIVYYFFKKYITPEISKKYDVIFLGVEDVEIDDFSWQKFLQIMSDNQLDMASPALSQQSITPHKIMYQQSNKVGRLVDVIEVFVTAFDSRAWPKFWELIEKDSNHWGWGYVQLAQSYCGFKMGIVDCETISVTRPPNFKQESLDEMNIFMSKHSDYERAKFISYGKLK